MKSKSEVLQAVKQFAKEIRAPDAIICNSANEQKSQYLRKFMMDMGTSLRLLETGTPWDNRAELYIGLMKEEVRKDMKEYDCPMILWDYCIERRARVNNLTAKDAFKLKRTNAHSATLGNTGDISNICQLKWYTLVYST